MNRKIAIAPLWWLGGATFLILALAVTVYAVTTGPSAFCHVSDGIFTDCDKNPATGVEEWSDIVATSFNGSGGATLYVDQADLHPTKSIPNGSGIDTLVLMYDEVQRTFPLLPGETVNIHFMTVDELKLLHYDVAIGSTGIMSVHINGVKQTPIPSGLSGIARFGPSPKSAVSHVTAEFQIGLEAAGFTSMECCYSPDPAWWGSSVAPNPVCPNGKDTTIPTELLQLNLTGQQFQIDPRQCVLQNPVTTTAAIIAANLDGTTKVEPQPLLPAGNEPSLCESIGRIVDFRVPPTGTYKNHGDYVKKVAQLTEALVNSQVAAGLITAKEAETLQSCVVNPRARSNVGK